MKRSKKAMAFLKLVVIVVLIVILSGVFVRLMWNLGKSALEAIGFNFTPEGAGGPALADKISITSAQLGNEPVTVYPSSSTESGDFDEISCGGACTLTLVFDRNLEKFSTDYFTVREKRGWASGWRESAGITVGSLLGNSVTLVGFEEGIKYFVMLSTTADYEEAKTTRKYKLNEATSALRFETS